ncbi:MAG TPA: efflux RND transporter periplasmic adaptor subunit [Alphaproteobacteria bacterium]|nr:efflux RND transporter periplasmic adaptor subunit [Alphaproteobacteria bacterium]
MAGRLSKHPILGVAIVFVIAVVGAFGYRFYTAQQQHFGRKQGPTPVVIAPVQNVMFVDRISSVGTAEANESVTLTAKVTETVSKVRFDDGDFVDKGDILVEMTNAQESALLAEAEANLQQAQREYDRTSDLVKQGVATRSRMDTATAGLKSAKAKVDGILAQLNDRLIRAPFSGILGFRNVSDGTLLTPTTPITTLDDISVIKLDFAVPEIDLAALHPGLEIEATSSAYPGKVFKGVVRTVNSRVDPATRAVTVRAEVKNKDRSLRPGMLLNVNLIRSRGTVLAIPEGALVPVQDKQYVYVLNGDATAHRREVTIGRRRPGMVEIKDGLKLGDKVISQGTLDVRDGDKVEVVSQEKPLVGDGQHAPTEQATPKQTSAAQLGG